MAANEPQVTTVTAPNQIQLEVQINEQYDGIDEDESDLPPVESNEPQQPPPEQPTKPKHTWLPLMAFFAILIAFTWPFILVVLNYYTDWNLWNFIRETRDSYNDAYAEITSTNTNISVLTCTFNGVNSLAQFESFLLNTSATTECQCNYMTIATINCTELSNSAWTTTNFEYDACMNADADATCLECTDCAASSFYTADSPYYLYSKQQYDAIKSIKAEKEKYCSPQKMFENIRDDVMDSYFTHCSNACIAFFCISGVWICCQLCAGCKVRYEDLRRSYLWCLKGSTLLHSFCHCFVLLT